MPENESGYESESASWEYALSVPNDLRAVTVSRRTLRLILTLHGLIGLVDTAELVAAELMSNAVRHTRGPADLRVCWSGGVLRIGAWDAGPEPPRPPCPLDFDLDLGLDACVPGEVEALGKLDMPGDPETGRGLAIVGACADAWGWEPAVRCSGSGAHADSAHGNGKYVWCELGAGVARAVAVECTV